jgi:hypothetical protein
MMHLNNNTHYTHCQFYLHQFSENDAVEQIMMELKNTGGRIISPAHFASFHHFCNYPGLISLLIFLNSTAPPSVIFDFFKINLAPFRTQIVPNAN